MSGGGPSLSELRSKYRERGDHFREENIETKEPFNIFSQWLTDALQSPDCHEPNAACLATVNAEGKPSNRFVLIKDFTKNGLTFFTHYGSRKAKDIEANPNVAITFYWLPLHRSVRIEGVAEKTSPNESFKYFHERPRPSQISALASAQSTKIPSREFLDDLEYSIKANLGDTDEVPQPNWGGYLVRPSLVEFWQGQDDRLHDRIRFRRGPEVEKEVDRILVHQGEQGWVYERLAP